MKTIFSMKARRPLQALSVAIALALGIPLTAFAKEKAGVEGMLDARVNAPQAAEQALAARADTVSSVRTKTQRDLGALREAARALAVQKPGVEVSWSPVTGAPSTVYARAGVLAEAKDTHEATVRGYLREARGVYGLSTDDLTDLQVLGVSDGGELGLPLVRMEQQVQGRPVFGSETRFVLDREGRLVKTLGDLAPNARASVPKVKAGVKLSANEAIVDVLASIGHLAHPQAFVQTGEHNGWLQFSETNEFVKGTVSLKEVWFPLSAGVLVPAWSVLVRTTGKQDYYAVVDGETGAILWRKDMRQYFSNQDARFRVYVQADGKTPADSPAPAQNNLQTPPQPGTQYAAITPSIVSMHSAMDPVASPNGWINDCPVGGCTFDESTTYGNNVWVCLDRTVGTDEDICDTDLANKLDGQGSPQGNPYLQTDGKTRNRDFSGIAPRDFETAYLPPPQNGNPEAGTSASAKLPSFDRGALTQAFYVANWWHDQMYKLGFNEGAGNFQETNFTGQGQGNDQVLINIQDANNAGFSSAPDGQSPYLELNTATGPTIDRDAALDSQIIIHELTHGLANRLVAHSTGLSWSVGSALSEGWGDFYALALLNTDQQKDPPAGIYTVQGYSMYKFDVGFADNYLYGNSRFPYTTNNSINPLSWADIDDVTYNTAGGMTENPLPFITGGMEPHHAGEIWALTLWEVRERIINDPRYANGNVANGNETMLKLVTQAMKMTPANPTLIEARDSLFEADCLLYGCAFEAAIWAGFADRGFGYGAAAPYAYMVAPAAPHLGIKESVISPQLDVVEPLVDVIVDDSAGNDNGAIDPNEPVTLRVALTNPWRGADKSAFDVTATLETNPPNLPGVTILDDTAKYSVIKPCEKDPNDMNRCKTQNADNGDSFLIKVESWIPSGSNLHFRLRTKPNSQVGLQGEMLTTFDLRTGLRSGPGTPYWTSASNLNVSIPDAPNYQGVVTNLILAQDQEIADLDFRVDKITHPDAGDIRVMLRSPQGIGSDLIGFIGRLNTVPGGGANITNMVIDDDVSATQNHNMLLAPTTRAPYTGSWLPTYNSNYMIPPRSEVPQDPVGNLSRYNGMSTQGMWSVVVSDDFDGDVGTLNGWSLGITPMNFTYSPFSGGQVRLAAMMWVDKKFPLGPGTTFQYLVMIPNFGTTVQQDNAGDEFTITLPPQLTLVKALASSGIATADVNSRKVTWNGIVKPAQFLLDNSVVIGIEAKINSNVTVGTQISAQGTLSYDADANGSNESTDVTNGLDFESSTLDLNQPTKFIVTDKIHKADFE